MPITTRFLFGALGALLLLASCGGGSVTGSLDISMTEFAYEEPTWTVAAGEEFTLSMSNDGTVVHNWSIVVPGREITSEGDLPIDPAERGDLYIFQVVLDAGDSVTRNLVAPPAGTYQVICDIQAHFSAGMAGTLTVEG